MTELLETLFSGVVLGSMYALMSMGLALVYGGLRVINLTQGALYMLGGYVAVIASEAGLPPLLGLLAGFLAMGVLGAVLYLGLLRWLAFRPDREDATLLATFGVALALQEIARFAFGPQDQAVPNLVPGNVSIGTFVVPWNAVFMVGAAIVCMSLLAAGLKWTRLGIAIRALAEERDGARLSGVSLHVISIVVLIVSSGLAGLSGVLLSTYYFVSPYVGSTYLILALIVTILGGLGSVGGALIAAYLVGLVQQLTSLYLGARWSLPILFLAIICVLAIRPGGVAGRAAADRL